ncbi:MAG: DUF6970 domain-containing protein [Crocinitomicaceae bacterium]
MKRLVYLLTTSFFFCLSAFQCNKYTPSFCINSKVSSFKNEACSSGASVKQYFFQNQDVYSFDPGQCGSDMTVTILSNNCDTLGFLGGLSGNSTINGEDFSNAQFREVVWEN